MGKGEDTLQVSKSAIDFVQTRLDKAKDAHQQQIETLLAVIGAAFALPQILDRELISALISAMTGIASEGHTLLLGGIQFIVTILFALAVAMMLKRSRQ